MTEALDVCVMCDVVDGRTRYRGEVSRRDNDEVLFTGAWRDTPEAAKREAHEWMRAESSGPFMTEKIAGIWSVDPGALPPIPNMGNPDYWWLMYQRREAEASQLAGRIIALDEQVLSALRASHAELRGCLASMMDWARELPDQYLDSDPEVRASFVEDLRAARAALAHAPE